MKIGRVRLWIRGQTGYSRRMDARHGPSAIFDVRRPPGVAGPIVFASPHSGYGLPADMRAASELDARSLRSAEDVAVDELLDSAPSHGVSLIRALISRAYVDLNRSAEDLDPLLTPDAPPPPPGSGAMRIAAGYGVTARRTGDGRDLYDRPVPLFEVRARLAAVHEPYHHALAELMRRAHADHGRAILIDWHSMPSSATGPGRGPDVVLGDRHGASCEARLTRRMKAVFEQAGWTVALNRPYAGGYTTQTWGRPAEGFQALQVELNRSLYLDEGALAPSSGFDRCRNVVGRVVAALSRDFG